MEAKEILQKVKQYFNELAAAPEVMAAPIVEPTEYELKDGGKVMIDVLEVGGIVMIDGSPALAGEAELVDGTKMTIGDNGVINAIEMGSGEAPAEPAMPIVEDMGTKFAAFETLTSEKFANYEIKFSAYEQRFADYEVKMKKANKVIDELLKLSTLLVEAPVQAPDSSVRTSNTFKEVEQKKNLNILFN